MKNLKTTIITALLLLAMVSGAVAQEKWEYAIINCQFFDGKAFLSISINGKEYKELKVEKKDLKSTQFFTDMNPALNSVAELQNEGWELTNYIGGGYAYSFLFRKKKQ